MPPPSQGQPSPALLSQPSTARSMRTPKYLPLPQPTSATTLPEARLSRKARTLGHTANLVDEKCEAMMSYTCKCVTRTRQGERRWCGCGSHVSKHLTPSGITNIRAHSMVNGQWVYIQYTMLALCQPAKLCSACCRPTCKPTHEHSWWRSTAAAACSIAELQHSLEQLWSTGQPQDDPPDERAHLPAPVLPLCPLLLLPQVHLPCLLWQCLLLQLLMVAGEAQPHSVVG